MKALRNLMPVDVLFAVLQVLTAPAPGQAAPPNIVLILCDDMGYSDIGCYGGEIRTPNLDRLAADGLQFTQFYNNAKCVESRASLLTGLYYQQTRNMRLANHVTLAEVLRSGGYSTYMVGKWHLPGLPVNRGFDRWFGFTGGDGNYFTGNTKDGRPQMWLDRERYSVPDSGFYATDDFTDYAIRFLDEAAQRRQPFFLYAAYNAPHFPLHAHPQDIDGYRGKYLAGWDELRSARYHRLQEMRLLKPSWELSLRDPIVPAWDSLDESRRKAEDLLMAVYAAMVDRLDQNIGRLLTHLETTGADENTLVLFLADNGACPYDFNLTPNVAPGPADSWRSYNSPWANLSNTPFRYYKQWCHEGGISTPCLVRWPGVVAGGTRTDEVAHLIDIMPTLVEVSGTAYPRQFDGHPVLPPEGMSIVSVLKGGSARTDEPLFWEFRAHHAVRSGRWKLVAERSKDWELYDLEADRSEQHNLVSDHPEQRQRLETLYAAWAERVGAVPHEQARKLEPAHQAR